MEFCKVIKLGRRIKDVNCIACSTMWTAYYTDIRQLPELYPTLSYNQLLQSTMSSFEEFCTCIPSYESSLIILISDTLHSPASQRLIGHEINSAGHVRGVSNLLFY